MPDESCRKCGCPLIPYSICCKCKQTTLEVCIKCGTQTQYRFHAVCFYEIEAIQTSSVVAMIAN